MQERNNLQPVQSAILGDDLTAKRKRCNEAYERCCKLQREIMKDKIDFSPYFKMEEGVRIRLIDKSKGKSPPIKKVPNFVREQLTVIKNAYESVTDDPYHEIWLEVDKRVNELEVEAKNKLQPPSYFDSFIHLFWWKPLTNTQVEKQAAPIKTP